MPFFCMVYEKLKFEKGFRGEREREDNITACRKIFLLYVRCSFINAQSIVSSLISFADGVREGGRDARRERLKGVREVGR